MNVRTDAPQINTRPDQNTRLLRALAEEIKLPLLQVARMAEHSKQAPSSENMALIETTADAALQLLDGYLLSTKLLLRQQSLDLEPVPVSSLLYDTAQRLYGFSKLYNTKIDIEVRGKCGLVMAHAQGLYTALISLAYTAITNGTVGHSSQPRTVTLLAEHRSGYVTTGVLTGDEGLKLQNLDRARRMYGVSHQPAHALHTAGAGIYVADSLFSAMSGKLHYRKMRQTHGLVAPLLPSQQLALL